MTLTAEERAELDRMTRTGKAAAAKLAKARVLLLADEAEGGPAWSDRRIVEAVGLGMTTVCRVRERFVEQGVEAAINRKASDRVYARKLDGRAEARLIKLACSKPPQGRSAVDAAAAGRSDGVAGARRHRLLRDGAGDA